MRCPTASGILKCSRIWRCTTHCPKDDVITISFGPDSTKAMIARWAVRSLEDTPADAQNDLI